MHITSLSKDVQQPATGLRPGLAALALAAGMMFTLACNRDQVSRSSAPASAPAGSPMGNMPMGNMPAGGELPPPPRPTGIAALKWTLPKGWTETQGSGMRFATLTPPGSGKAELAVVVLPAPAGGELANVNRWRGQIGLSPLDEKALGSARQAVKSKAGVVSVYDFTSEGQEQSRMITGLIATTDGNIWFLKLLGDAAPVGKAKPDFMRFLETLHLD